jgi:hypothetical protein
MDQSLGAIDPFLLGDACQVVGLAHSIKSIGKGLAIVNFTRPPIQANQYLIDVRYAAQVVANDVDYLLLKLTHFSNLQLCTQLGWQIIQVAHASAQIWWQAIIHESCIEQLF